MATAEDTESLKQENFARLLRIDELEEKTERVEWELEVAQIQKEQAEAKAGGLEHQAQAGKREGGSKEIGRVIVVEAERTRALEQLIANGAQKSQEREEKLQKMQREMAAWKEKPTTTCTTQTREQKEILQKLEVAKSMIEVLQKEVRSQADHIQELQDELDEWQQKCFHAKHQAQELWDELLKSHAQAKETGKAFAQEMEKIKANLANYENLYNRSLSLESEVEAGTKETERLRSQLQRVEAERDHMGE
ncbi:tropomyosin alpha-3 chain-like [Alligator sinensis]|uniref:Tropomyosin alpha-3 chain-like n=1 Tax=Alligator sinensis TaxID=38654 RepID=A0A1U8DVU5_ALLSI|nr:tropomyosin alpha-3 chain-like [Alligator sinensis]